jgi:hypothetical protein
MTGKQVSGAFLKKSAAPPVRQKTFAEPAHGRFQQHGIEDQKFFASFFQKRSACLFSFYVAP